MRAMEGINIPGSLDATELSLVSSLIIPHKFKTLTFDKYDGTKCPTTHLTMYCQKMSTYTDNDKLLIYCFQDSLMGIVAQQYLKLDKAYIWSQKDLARAFLTQHKHATKFIPDRLCRRPILSDIFYFIVRGPWARLCSGSSLGP